MLLFVGFYVCCESMMHAWHPSSFRKKLKREKKKIGVPQRHERNFTKRNAGNERILTHIPHSEVGWNISKSPVDLNFGFWSARAGNEKILFGFYIKKKDIKKMAAMMNVRWRPGANFLFFEREKCICCMWACALAFWTVLNEKKKWVGFLVFASIDRIAHEDSFWCY